MRLDVTALPDGARLQAQVCVVGAGPAGITTALELGRAGLDVLLVESGGDAFAPGVQQLGEAASADPHSAAMSLATRRQVGGTSHLWGGRCVPYDPVDFEDREILGGTTWPVGYDELTPYFQRACDWMKCGDAVFDARLVPELADRELVPGMPEGDFGSTALERWSLPTNFASEYSSELDASQTVRVATGLTAVQIEVDDAGTRVQALVVRALDGRTMRVEADTTIVATGGLEATRLLLNSRSASHPDGLGNHADHLGRWYMAHIESRIARVAFTPPAGGDVLYSHEQDAAGVYVRRRFSLSPEAQRAHGLPNAVVWLVNPELGDAGHGSGILSFVYLMLSSPFGRFFVAEAIRQSHLKTSAPVSMRGHLRNLARDLVPATVFAFRFAYERYLRPGRKVPGFFVRSAANTYPILYHGEHKPQVDSRVTLSDRLDLLGVPRLDIDMRFADAEAEDVVRAHELLAAQLEATGSGRLEFLHDDPAAAVRKQLFGGYHQTGTTRISADPADGVVDPDLRVHGVEGLHVVSSSTFPTSSQANSTFMIVVFALRLADHLRARVHAAGGERCAS